jgi:hypothetical protein
VDVANGIGRDISRAELEKYLDGDEMTVVCKVGFDGDSAEPSAMAFPAVSYTIKKLDDFIAPTITSVTDSKGQVANGGTTFDTSVTLLGKASASQQVQLFDNGASKGNASVSSNGDWTLGLTGLTVASHSIIAKALYGSNPESAARTFDVLKETPLSIDQSPMRLNGFFIYNNWPRTAIDVPGVSATRVARGGTPPYSYSSSDIDVTVDSNGKVQCFKNRNAVITVRDRNNKSVSYSVASSNKWRFAFFEYQMTYQDALSSAAESRGLAVTLERWAQLKTWYVQPLPVFLQDELWCCTTDGCSGGSALGCRMGDYSHFCASPTALYGAIFLIL